MSLIYEDTNWLLIMHITHSTLASQRMCISRFSLLATTREEDTVFRLSEVPGVTDMFDRLCVFGGEPEGVSPVGLDTDNCKDGLVNKATRTPFPAVSYWPCINKLSSWCDPSPRNLTSTEEEALLTGSCRT